MSRKFIATILTASLALTSFTAVPARASDRDLVQFLAGATALIIIGSALSDSNRHTTATQQQPRNQDRYRQQENRRHEEDRRRHDDWRSPDRGRRVAALPGGCLIQANTQYGRQRVFGARCLEVHYSQANRLPDTCRTRISDRDGRRPGYLASCLAQRGFRVRQN
ncbi:hypothetical protein TG4357_01355 [Thalassovita gelatinovora]|uniref:Uncharacterized protein n=1 Tax=Thalassovita gelatinovora TaxID=53501 RepID=A0A0P1F8S4_THAGE|nr:hypothetical protein [Thalassovita gelatinovora]QIZ81294.1 hypothetical protein HFZ77_12825 [Thalassovita gelatinovora]CUH64556.1 hypothetical protein TG4357_01355 [Thalassovita gelatinovora]SEP96195.1 hypothetical protein SAMN04488043_102321 [Thalassovita gelatinovora]